MIESTVRREEPWVTKREVVCTGHPGFASGQRRLCSKANSEEPASVGFISKHDVKDMVIDREPIREFAGHDIGIQGDDVLESFFRRRAIPKRERVRYLTRVDPVEKVTIVHQEPRPSFITRQHRASQQIKSKNAHVSDPQASPVLQDNSIVRPAFLAVDD